MIMSFVTSRDVSWLLSAAAALSVGAAALYALTPGGRSEDSTSNELNPNEEVVSATPEQSKAALLKSSPPLDSDHAEPKPATGTAMSQPADVCCQQQQQEKTATSPEQSVHDSEEIAVQLTVSCAVSGVSAADGGACSAAFADAPAHAAINEHSQQQKQQLLPEAKSEQQQQQQRGHQHVQQEQLQPPGQQDRPQSPPATSPAQQQQQQPEDQQLKPEEEDTQVPPPPSSSLQDVEQQRQSQHTQQQTAQQQQHQQQTAASALSLTPSDRDKAIMYRLAIDKPSFSSSNSSNGPQSPEPQKVSPGSPVSATSPTAASASTGGLSGALGIIAAFERSLSCRASMGGSESPRIVSPRLSSSSSIKQRSVFNTARNQPSLDTTVASAAVARSLAVQYADSSNSSNGPLGVQDVQPLAASCARLCEQHCSKLHDTSGELGETTAMDIGCGTGGSCFELALSFSHVLGIDGDSMHVVAAKEMKDKGCLQYRPVIDSSAAAAGGTCVANVTSSSHSSCDSTAAEEQQLQDEVCVARVSEECDRDKVRFWSYPLPDLPPKLQPVDAVLVEDVEGRLKAGLHRVCEQLPALLNPGGVCVVVLPEGCSGSPAGTAVSTSSSRSERTVAAGVLNQMQESASSCGIAADSAVDNAAVATEAGKPSAVSAAKAVDAVSEADGLGSISISSVRQWLEVHGLQFVEEQQLQYPVAGSQGLQVAIAGVWLQPK